MAYHKMMVDAVGEEILEDIGRVGLEHGLPMSWTDDHRLVKVGEYDGHSTSDVAHGWYVFSCHGLALYTLLDSI